MQENNRGDQDIIDLNDIYGIEDEILEESLYFSPLDYYNYATSYD